MSSIENVKKEMGWQSGNQRDRCENCKHVREEPTLRVFEAASWRCDKGDFFTRTNAICGQHLRAVNT